MVRYNDSEVFIRWLEWLYQHTGCYMVGNIIVGSDNSEDETPKVFHFDRTTKKYVRGFWGVGK